MKLGVMGMSPGNGHPFSFSAIVNGYSDEGFAKSGWPVIHEYLRAKDATDFGFPEVEVTHAWTQDARLTQTLCEACRIGHAIDEPEDFVGAVDAVLLARDDYENHFAMAIPLLERGLAVFVDKPLTLEIEELRALRPHLESGRLMSCSAMACAPELDTLRSTLPEYGDIKLVRAAVILDWAKYGVHMVDAVLGLGYARPVAVTPCAANHESFAIGMDDGSLFQVDALGEASKNFRLDVFGSRRDSTHQLFDNFQAFRRLLGHFIRVAKGDDSARWSDLTQLSMKTLMAGRRAAAEGRTVTLDEFAA